MNEPFYVTAASPFLAPTSYGLADVYVAFMDHRHADHHPTVLLSDVS
jgi:hypothetical protein